MVVWVCSDSSLGATIPAAAPQSSQQPEPTAAAAAEPEPEQAAPEPEPERMDSEPQVCAVSGIIWFFFRRNQDIFQYFSTATSLF